MGPKQSQAAKWAVVVLGSVALGWTLDWLRVPAAWIVAAIVVSGTMALSTGRDLPVNHNVYALSRGFIGILAAIPLTTMPARLLLEFLPSGVVVAVATILVGVVGGVLLNRAEPDAVSRETGILSMLPGGASMMPLLADELGADYRYVALTQYLRLLVVSVSLPVVVSFMAHPSDVAGVDAAAGAVSTPWWLVVITVLVAASGERLGKLAHLPVPSVIGPLVLTILISLALPDGLTMSPLEPFKILAFMTIGWVCGGGLSLPALRRFGKQLPATFLFIFAIISVCALTAWPLTGLLDISYFEAYLATTPGALETVLALSSEGGAGPAVVALQLIRLILVLAVAGYLPQLLRMAARGPR